MTQGGDGGRTGAAPYVPVEDRPWRLTMGLRPLDTAAWLEVDAHRASELRRKWRLLDRPAGRAQAVAITTGCDAAGAELLTMVVAHLDAQHPGLVTPSAGGGLLDRSTGRRIEVGALHPVDAAGRLVQEDLCLMTRDRRGWVLGAASVCFPSRWSLADKIGRTLDGIHAPVPGYGRQLGRPVAAFFDRLRVDRPVWRLNWTLLDTPELTLPAPSARRSAPPVGPDLGEQLWFRVERQTLRRLEPSGAVAFTIRTYVTDLATLVASHPAVVGALATSLAGVPPETATYKGWDGLLPQLLEWLDGRTAGPE